MSAVKFRWPTGGLKVTTGAAAIEFALSLPLFLILLIGTVEIGSAVYQAMQVYNSVEAGALYAAKKSFHAAEIAAAVTIATQTPAPQIAATPEPVKIYGCATANGVTFYATAPAYCSDGSAPGEYARIDARRNRVQILESVFPDWVLPLPTVLNAKSVIRTD